MELEKESQLNFPISFIDRDCVYKGDVLYPLTGSAAIVSCRRSTMQIYGVLSFSNGQYFLLNPLGSDQKKRARRRATALSLRAEQIAAKGICGNVHSGSCPPCIIRLYLLI